MGGKNEQVYQGENEATGRERGDWLSRKECSLD